MIWGVGIASIDPIRAVGSIRAVGGALRTLFDGMVAGVIVVFVVVQSNLAIRMWGGPAKIKNISRYSYIKVCNAAKLIPAGLRSIFLYTRIFLYQVFLYPGLTVYTNASLLYCSQTYIAPLELYEGPAAPRTPRRS